MWDSLNNSFKLSVGVKLFVTVLRNNQIASIHVS